MQHLHHHRHHPQQHLPPHHWLPINYIIFVQWMLTSKLYFNAGLLPHLWILSGLLGTHRHLFLKRCVYIILFTFLSLFIFFYFFFRLQSMRLFTLSIRKTSGMIYDGDWVLDDSATAFFMLLSSMSH